MTIKKLKNKIFCCAGSAEYGAWWFRVFTHGLQLKASWNDKLFSERYGHKNPIIKLNGWRVFYLAPPKGEQDETL